MAGNLARKKGKKNRKWGRNKLKCAAYRNSRKRERNKKRNLLRHLNKHPADTNAKSALAAL